MTTVGMEGVCAARRRGTTVPPLRSGYVFEAGNVVRPSDQVYCKLAEPELRCVVGLRS